MKKRVKGGSLKKEIAIGIVIGVVIGIIASALFLKYSSVVVEKEVRTFCEVDPITLYGKSCQHHEDCYGRSELCDVNTHKCVISAKLNKTLIGNARMPLSKSECESVNGVWKVEIVASDKS